MEHNMSYLLILCCALIHMSLAGSDIFLYHVFGLTGTTIIFGCKAVTYLLYPLLGWMADVFLLHQIQVCIVFFHCYDTVQYSCCYRIWS